MKNQRQGSSRPLTTFATRGSHRSGSAGTPQPLKRHTPEYNSPPRKKRVRRESTTPEEDEDEEYYSGQNEYEYEYDEDEEYEVLEEPRRKYRKFSVKPVNPVQAASNL